MDINATEINKTDNKNKSADNNNKKIIKSLLKENIKLNIEDISTKKLEIFSLNKLPETNLIELDNLIDYKTPLYLSQRINSSESDIIKSALIWPRENLSMKNQSETTTSITESTNGNTSNIEISLQSTKTEDVENTTTTKVETNETVNESDYKKIESKLEYGRPPPSAPRLSLESTSSLLRQFEQISTAPAVSRIANSKESCGCYHQPIIEDTSNLGNQRIIQATSIPPNITRICIRSIDADPNFEQSSNQQIHHSKNLCSEIINKKWTEYYDSIRSSENYNDYRKRFENDELNCQHQIPADYKNNNKNFNNELRNKRIERVKQEDIISNNLNVERVTCKNREVSINKNLRDQECQFPSPCARCLQIKKIKAVNKKSPLTEEKNLQKCEAETQTQYFDKENFTTNAQKLLDNSKQNHLQPLKEINGKSQNVTPYATNLKKDGYYNFLTPLLNDKDKDILQQLTKQQLQQHLDINIQTSSTPSTDCHHNSIDKETNTNLIHEDKTQQCPSPSFDNFHRVINDKECQYPTLRPQLRRYVVDMKEDELVDFNNKNTPSYQKFLKRVEIDHEQPIKMKDNVKHCVKFNDLKEHKQISIILPSKQTQTFYNGYKMWKTPSDLIISGPSKYVFIYS